MRTLVIVDNPKHWPLNLQGVEIVPARNYLTDPRFSSLRNTKVFNLCKSYRYQAAGYYVSLLAEARGHKPIPKLTTIQDMKSQTMVRFVSDDLDQLIQKSLEPVQSDRFDLSVYFGKNLAKRYDRLSSRLFKLFNMPLLQAHFVHQKKWTIQSINPVAGNDIPDAHRPFVIEVANDFFARRPLAAPRKSGRRFDLAILRDPAAQEAPSGDKALKRFIKAAHSLEMEVELIDREDYGRLAEFDALFIRETTNVNHHTYRFARRAAAENMVVIDDPESILKCTNKVFLAELLERHRIPTPKTLIIHRDNLEQAGALLGYPCILKQPDSSFSNGVEKVCDRSELIEKGKRLLSDSELIIAQEYVPTDYDWRIGVLDRKPLFACKYFMAKNHWQIINRTGKRKDEGLFETLPVAAAPERVVQTALRAANLIGDGLYGVDVKATDRKICVIEVNDNPNIDAGVEDQVLKDELYLLVMSSFLHRIERRKEGSSR